MKFSICTRLLNEVSATSAICNYCIGNFALFGEKIELASSDCIRSEVLQQILNFY